MVNGYSAIALTKLDILDDLDEIQIGITYKKNETPMEHFPSCEQVSTLVFLIVAQALISAQGIK